MFDVAILVNSADTAASAVSGTMRFDNDRLELVSVIKAGSMINLWTIAPLFPTQTGQGRFEGVIQQPGFLGSGGNVLTLRFRAKDVGAADLSFSNSSVMASDDRGTNILDKVTPASFTITAAPAQPPAGQPRVFDKAIALPSPCSVGSMTHPDPLMWVADNDPAFTWSLTPDVTGVSYYIDGRPDTLPDTQSEGLLDSYSTGGQSDGIWYFHCRLENNLGWGPSAHYQFRIDTAPPQAFDIRYLDADQTGLGESWLAFRTIDDLSGIDHYSVYIDNDWSVDVPAGPDYGWRVFAPSSLEPGDHDIEILAVDQAGNSISAARKLTVALPLSLWEAALALESWKLALLLAALLLTILVIVRLLWSLYPCPTKQDINRQVEALRRRCEELVYLTTSEWKDIDKERRHPRRLIWGEGDRCLHLKSAIDAADRAVRRAIRRFKKK